MERQRDQCPPNPEGAGSTPWPLSKLLLPFPGRRIQEECGTGEASLQIERFDK